MKVAKPVLSSCLALTAILLSLLTGCNSTIDPVLPEPTAIFPVDSGKTRMYYVMDTVYQSTGGQFDDLRYYKRELGGGTAKDLLGRELSKLLIYTSPDSLDSMSNPVFSWTFSELWSRFADDQGAELSEGNIRYQVLKFPIMEGLSWDGNSLNDEGEQTYEYISVDSTVTVNGIEFDDCVVVLQVPFRTAGTKISFYIEEFAYEIYAPGVGKIFKYKKVYSQQNPSDIDTDSRVLIETIVSWD